MDKYKIDSHKLIYHPQRVGNWLKGKDTPPIYLEISPSGGCNHRCVYCALDFMRYQPRFLDTAILLSQVKNMSKAGVKSIMYAGEGEPFLHPDMAKIAIATKQAGIDVAFTTNGVLFTSEIAQACLGSTNWIKVSINGATPGTYSKIHGSSPADYHKVMDNLTYAARLRRKKKYSCALGMQVLLLPENRHEVMMLAEKAKKTGMDYLVVKPYSQHPLSHTQAYKNIKYSDYLPLAQELKKFNDKKFNVVFRLHAMEKWDEARLPYKHCYALAFWSYIDSGGDVWACSAYLTDKRFLLGNIYKDSFEAICASTRRKRVLAWAAKQFDVHKCRINCRMDEVNRYLWELKNPGSHVNFI